MAGLPSSNREILDLLNFANEVGTVGSSVIYVEIFKKLKKYLRLHEWQYEKYNRFTMNRAPGHSLKSLLTVTDIVIFS